MSNIQSWGELISGSFISLWSSFIQFLPKLIISLVLFIIGWIIAVAIGKLIEQIIKTINLDQALTKLNFNKPLERAGLKLNTGAVFGEITKWFVVLVALMVSTEIVGLAIVTDLLKQILFYVPQVIVAAIILVVGIMVANLLQKVVQASLEAAHMGSSVVLGLIAKWGVLIFAFFSALIQLGVTSAQLLFTGLVYTLVIAFGLSFGLGGKDIAADFLRKIKEDISRKS